MREVRELQFIHGLLSVPMPHCFRRHHDVPCELDDSTDQLIAILDKTRSYSTSARLGSVNDRPYNDLFLLYSWNPPHAFSSMSPYNDLFLLYSWNPPHAFSSMSEYASTTITASSSSSAETNSSRSRLAVFRQRQRSTSLMMTFSFASFSSKASRLQGLLTGGLDLYRVQVVVPWYTSKVDNLSVASARLIVCLIHPAKINVTSLGSLIAKRSAWMTISFLWHRHLGIYHRIY